MISKYKKVLKAFIKKVSKSVAQHIKIIKKYSRKGRKAPLF